VVAGPHPFRLETCPLKVTIAHVAEVMEEIAPSFFAEPWDNIGLQVGNSGWPVEKIWTALDPSGEVVKRASQSHIDLIVCHHPLIFKPLSRLDPVTDVGETIDVALKHRVGIFSSHTNFDAAPGGMNDMLAAKLGLLDTRVLKATGERNFRVVTYVPEGYENKVAEALFAAGAGKSSRYSHISFQSEGTGSFKPLAGAKPFIGKGGVVTHTREFRFEILVPRQRLAGAVQALLSAHPYEEVVYDVYPLEPTDTSAGLGRIGTLEDEISLESFVTFIKAALGIETLRLAGNLSQRIRTVAVCAGSGKGLLQEFLASNAQVFVSGDLGYHDGRTAEQAGRAVVDVGHFASERLFVEGLVARLTKAFAQKRYSVEVTPYGQEVCCYRYL
jgi:dinuclear metal center YbgI/SA1388 family protein